MTQNTMSNIAAIFSPRREYYSFYSFFIFLKSNTHRPLCFMWKPRIDTTKILYFLWSNIVWSKNKKRTTYVIHNIYLNLSFLYVFMFRQDRMKQQRYDFLILRPLVYLFSVVSSPETKIEDVIK